MKRRFGSFVVSIGIGVLFAGGAVHAQSTPKDALLVLAKHDHTLAIVDPTSLRTIARIPVGNDPHEVVASEDGKSAYASNYGGGTLHTIAVVDLVGQKPLQTMELGPLLGPHGVTFAGGKTWFTAEGSKAIGTIDPATQRVDWVLGTGQDRTHMIFVSTDLKRIVTANVNSGTISIIEKSTQTGGPPGPPRSDWEETVVKVGNAPEGFDVTPDGKQIWVANAKDGTVSVIDSDTKEVQQTLDADVKGANRLKFTPDGKLALISTLNGRDLVVLDVSTRKTAKRVTIGTGAGGILIQPDGARAYVSCSPDNYVAVVDLKTLSVVGRIDAGLEPDGLAWASRR
jgi:YVTN family beta-propeller protein